MTIKDKYAPIALFLYNRPDKTSECLNSLKNLKEFYKSPLYIFIDGAKSIEDKKKISEIDSLIKNLNFHNLKVIHKHKKNQGLANSIFFGVSKVLSEYNKVIVIEDDLIFHKSFLEFMNQCLVKYNQKDIYQISGFTWNNYSKNMKNEPILIPNISSWGWATWKNKWENFKLNKVSKESLKMNSIEKKNFNMNNSYNYYKILKKHLNGKVDSWAIQWYFYVFKRSGKTIYPNISLTRNNGFDGDGSNTFRKKKYFGNISKDLKIYLSIITY